LTVILPSLDRARAELVGDDELARIIATDPSRAFAAAAIVLHSDGVLREQWDDDVEMSDALFARFPRGLAPAPAAANANATYKFIPDDAIARRGPCTHCSITRGKVFCPTCDGAGTVMSGDVPIGCAACASVGMIPCPNCDGSAVCVSVKVRYVSDKWLTIRRLFVPNLGPLRSKVEPLIDPSDVWPAEHVFEPQPQVVASAYRGASSVREPDFNGFFFGDALGQAISAIGELASGSTRTCFAVPVLWLVWEGLERVVHVGLVAQPHGGVIGVHT